MPDLEVLTGDDVELTYKVDIEYIGQVAAKLRVMKRLGAVDKSAASTSVLIKQVFEVFKEALE